MKTLFFISVIFLASQTSNAQDYGNLEDIIDGNHRSALHKSRDQYRHPVATLNFFEVKPNMTVVEIWPGGKGWYTEILAPYLKDNGTLYAANFAADSGIPYFTKNVKKFNQKFKAQPELYGNLIITELNSPNTLNFAPLASADRVLTFRNVHNWMKSDQADNVFKAMYDVLKPGGILGVVEHRAIAGSPQDPKAISGYVTEEHVIKLAEAAGFKLQGKSEINANPKDTTAHPKGVWTLPPSLRLKEQNKEQYLEIGESDRMTLKFVKPKLK